MPCLVEGGKSNIPSWRSGGEESPRCGEARKGRGESGGDNWPLVQFKKPSVARDLLVGKSLRKQLTEKDPERGPDVAKDKRTLKQQWC